ncbi:MAG: thioredoxin family protein [Bacillus sp. (in: firmicutes)]
MEWTGRDLQEAIDKRESFCLYLYTPMCGTCQVASRMLEIVEEVFGRLTINKTDINYVQELAHRYEIESVPCLMIFHKGEHIQKIYAFQSVPYLAEQIKQHMSDIRHP